MLKKFSSSVYILTFCEQKYESYEIKQQYLLVTKQSLLILISNYLNYREDREYNNYSLEGYTLNKLLFRGNLYNWHLQKSLILYSELNAECFCFANVIFSKTLLTFKKENINIISKWNETKPDERVIIHTFLIWQLFLFLYNATISISDIRFFPN